MGTKKLATLFMAAVALSACSSGGGNTVDEPDVPTPPVTDERIPINISANVNDMTGTRVTDLSFETNDQIGLYVVNRNADGTAVGLAAQGNHVDNMRFTYNGNWVPDTPIYWLDDKTNADFYVYHPYKSGITDVAAVPFSVNADQSTEAAYKAGDVLVGSTMNVAPTATAVGVNVKHIMSQMVIKVAPGNGFTAESLAASTVGVKINGVKTGATVNLSTAAVTATGDAVSITPLNTGESYKALIVPQSVGEGSLITVTVDGRDFNLNKSFTFESGRRYNFNVVVSKTSEGVNVTIGQWNDDGVDYGGTAE